MASSSNAARKPFESRTAFITGGGSGIGRALAHGLAARGIKVVIGGRREDSLREACTGQQNMEYYVVDVTDTDAVRRCVTELTQRYPELDCIINNAGMQRPYSLTEPPELNYGDAEIDVNLRAPLQLTAAFLPHLRSQPNASIINVTSGLAHIPLARTPVYCATKAAMRSFTVSLRYQLRDTAVRVIEIVPPAVQTELHDYMGEDKGRAVGIPIEQFQREAMEGLERGDDEILVAQATDLKHGSQTAFQKTFEGFNKAMGG